MPKENEASDAPAGLSPLAYVSLEKGEQYEPYVSAAQNIPEFTAKSVAFGYLIAGFARLVRR